MSENHFEINGMTAEQIPMMIGKNGKNLFHNICLKSIINLSNLSNHKCLPTLKEIKSRNLMLKVFIRIEKENDKVYAIWKNIPQLESGKTLEVDPSDETKTIQSQHDLNIELNSIIQKNITAAFKKINNNHLKLEVETDFPKKTTYKSKFNYRVVMDHSHMGTLIGEGGSNIKKLKNMIEDEIKCENTFIKILKYDSNTMYDQYRTIGYDDGNVEYLLFKVEYPNGVRSDILRVEEILINYINEVC